MKILGHGDLKKILALWSELWPEALEIWSRFIKLGSPRWCLNPKEARNEQLESSFAMIRLQDHAVVIDLSQIKAKGLEKFGREILAHEIGHHVYAPADLRDNARLLVRVKAGLPTREHLAGMIANLYTDLLINDRLQRGAGLDMSGVYKKLKVKNPDRLWTLYMRIYEELWNLHPGTLATADIDRQIRYDASLGAKVIRAYAKDWLDGAGRFAALCLDYLLKDPTTAEWPFGVWLDTGQAGAGGEIPDGLAEIEDEEGAGAIHPALDPDLTGIGPMDEDGDEKKESAPRAGGRAIIGGRKNNYRPPDEYTEVMKSLGVDLPEEELIIRYYRELARPHLVRFPTRVVKEAVDPLPESLDPWETGSPLSTLDWLESIVRSPYLIPGVTTVQRAYGTASGGSPEKRPVDLFLGVDCSGSMGNPKFNLSYSVLAGAVIVLSALRTGARVKVTLSGEPGEHSSTSGFIRDEREILKILTGYLGTGFAFGIMRLKDAFLKGEKPKRPTHIMIVTDADIFSMLASIKDGWGLAKRALETAGGGGTYVLNMSSNYYQEGIDLMLADGWNVHLVETWEDMIAFAREFSRKQYGDN